MSACGAGRRGGAAMERGLCLYLASKRHKPEDVFQAKVLAGCLCVDHAGRAIDDLTTHLGRGACVPTVLPAVAQGFYVFVRAMQMLKSHNEGTLLVRRPVTHAVP